MTFSKWNIESELGYKPITTFWMDFSIAEQYSKAGVIDTFRRAMKEWKNNYKYLTELVMVLNHKVAQHYRTFPDLAALYQQLFEQAETYALENLKGEELQYYYDTTN